MAEIPSDITGATVADVDTYAAARGYTDWTALDADPKSQALLRAWDYLESLSWIDGTFDDGLPDRVETAHIILTIYEGETPGTLKPTVDRENYVKKDGLGKGSLVTEYFEGAPTVARFPMVDRLLSDYMESSGVNVRLARG